MIMRKTILFFVMMILGSALYAQWQLANFADTLTVRSITSANALMYVGTEQAGVFVSKDAGNTWQQKNNGLTNLSVKCLQFFAGNIYAGTLGGGVFLSKDTGTTWLPVNIGMNMGNNQILSFYTEGNKLYATTWSYMGVFVTTGTDENAVWTQTALAKEVNGIVKVGNTYFAATRNDYVYKSTDFSTWTICDNKLTNPKIREMEVVGTKIFVATDGGGVFMTSNYGSSWAPMNNGLYIPYLLTIKKVGSYLYTTTGGIFRSNTEGASWKQGGHCLPDSMELYTLHQNGSTLFVGAKNGLYKADTTAILDRMEICMVTVDDNNKNTVLWEKPTSTSYDSIYVYKETNITNNYTIIGRVGKYETSQFVDTASKPDVQSNKYQLSFNDNCGLPIIKSAAHKTMHLAINAGIGNTWNLIWNTYEGFTVSSYNIYSGTSAANLTLLASVSGANTQYTDVSPPTGDVYYQVEVVSLNACTPSKTYSSTRSNVASNKLVGIDKINTSEVLMDVYPNPAQTFFYVNTSINNAQNAKLKIYTALGALVYESELVNTTTKISTINYQKGIYFVEFISSGFTSQKVLMIE